MKIKKIYNPSLVNPLIASKINEIISEVNRLALDEKKEEEIINEGVCLHCNLPTHKGRCWISKEEPKPECKRCEAESRKDYLNTGLAHTCGSKKYNCEHGTALIRVCKECEEPKSTLREATSNILAKENVAYRNYTDPTELADKIISLFKDTLLKEIQKILKHRISNK